MAFCLAVRKQLPKQFPRSKMATWNSYMWRKLIFGAERKKKKKWGRRLDPCAAIASFASVEQARYADSQALTSSKPLPHFPPGIFFIFFMGCLLFFFLSIRQLSFTFSVPGVSEWQRAAVVDRGIKHSRAFFFFLRVCARVSFRFVCPLRICIRVWWSTRLSLLLLIFRSAYLRSLSRRATRLYFWFRFGPGCIMCPLRWDTLGIFAIWFAL